jgi:hypothetical protein
MLVALILAAVALLVVTIAWGSIMDLGAAEQHRPSRRGSQDHRHAA